MTIETINVKGNASKVLEEHHSRLKSEAKEINNELHLNKPKKKVSDNCHLWQRWDW